MTTKQNKEQGQPSSALEERACHLLHRGNSAGLDGFVTLHYETLAMTAFRLLGNKHDAESLAANAFIRLWHRRQELNSAAEIKIFLYDTVLEGCQEKAHDQPFKALLEALVADRLVNVEV